jgi:hypothetical protein
LAATAARRRGHRWAGSHSRSGGISGALPLISKIGFFGVLESRAAAAQTVLFFQFKMGIPTIIGLPVPVAGMLQKL